MIEYNPIDTSTTDEQLKGYINLNLAIILQACIDEDREWLRSDHFRRTIMSLPDKMLQRELGIGLVEMTAKQVAFQLIKRVDRGDFQGRKMINFNFSRRTPE